MERRNFRNYHSNIAFLDLFFNMILGFVFLFVLSFLMVNIHSQKANIATKAEFVITLTWDVNNPDDVDLWVEDPQGNLIFFREKEKGLTHLDRDDLGKERDEVVLPDGRTISYPYNQEITTIRGIIPGDWTINVHMYRKNSDKPAEVEVKMEKLNPSVKLVIFERLVLVRRWEEKTVARFTMTESGDIINLSKDYKGLVEKKLQEISNRIEGIY